MKIMHVVTAVLILASCGGAEEAAQTSAPAAATQETVSSAVPTEEEASPADPNEGTHRYRYVEIIENNGCETSREVGDELTHETTFTSDRVEMVFYRDDLPEGVEPGTRSYDENLGAGVWQEQVEASDGSGVYVHTIEFSDSGVTMTSAFAGEPCLSSVRERIDS